MSLIIPFAFMRCTAADLPEIVRLQYACFPPEIRLLFMGCHSEAELSLITKRFTETAQTDPNYVWMGVKDMQSGKFIAASNWKIYLNGQAPAQAAESAPEWLQGKEYDAAKQVIGVMERLDLHICFTHESYRRRGAGSMMLKWGCKLADELFLPAWIEASKDGNFLYKKFGFYECGKIGEMYMQRRARDYAAIGGKPKSNA